MGSCILVGGGGVTMPYTDFGTWRWGNKGDKNLKLFSFDLFTLSINIH